MGQKVKTTDPNLASLTDHMLQAHYENTREGGCASIGRYAFYLHSAFAAEIERRVLSQYEETDENRG